MPLPYIELQIKQESWDNSIDSYNRNTRIQEQGITQPTTTKEFNIKYTIGKTDFYQPKSIGEH